MAIHFPKYDDVPLANSPLEEVVCQVRFPPILRIGSEEPSAFQERVRRRFPLLQQQQGVQIQIPGLGTPIDATAQVQPKIYRFASDTEETVLSLSLDFLALMTKHYTHWRDFAEDLKLAQEALHTVYEPLYATRIGLRYIDRFTFENTGCSTTDELFSLFRSEITVLLNSDVWSEPLGYNSQLLLADGDAKLRLQTKYGKENNEAYIILDFDYYEEGKLPIENLSERCEHYHEVIYNAFRWCLSEGSITIFQPLADKHQA